DGTIFYPGTTAKIGGTDDIPIESLRLKLIREGMEDYEYLVLVEKKDPTLAHSVADGLFPKAYDTHKTPDELEAARDKLFAALDSPVSPGDAGTDGGVGDGGGPDGSPDGDVGPGKDGAVGDGSPVGDTASGDGGPGGNGDNGGGDVKGSCGCRTPAAKGGALEALALLALASLVVVRRRDRHAKG